MSAGDVPLKDVDLRALIGGADAYQDAVTAYYEVAPGAPLSTTLGFLIRQGYLVPKDDALKALTEWFEDHPDLIGEGSAATNAVRLLDHAYDPEGCDDPIRLAANTPTLTRDDRQPRLGYASTDQLLRELEARIRTGGAQGNLPPMSRDILTAQVGDLRRGIATIDPALLDYTTVAGVPV